MSLPTDIANATSGYRSLSGLVQSQVRVDALSATGSVALLAAMEGAQEFVDVVFIPDVTIAASGTDYWSAQVINAGDDGSGSTAMSGAESFAGGLTAFQYESVTMTAPSLADGSVAKVTFTKTGSPSNLSGLLSFTHRRRITAR